MALKQGCLYYWAVLCARQSNVSTFNGLSGHSDKTNYHFKHCYHVLPFKKRWTVSILCIFSVVTDHIFVYPVLGWWHRVDRDCIVGVRRFFLPPSSRGSDYEMAPAGTYNYTSMNNAANFHVVWWPNSCMHVDTGQRWKFSVTWCFLAERSKPTCLQRMWQWKCSDQTCCVHSRLKWLAENSFLKFHLCFDCTSKS